MDNLKQSQYHFEPEKYETELLGIFNELSNITDLENIKIDKVIKRYPKDGNKIFGRDQLIAGLEWLIETDLASDTIISNSERLVSSLKLKPMRTQSGVTTVTVLTKPFMCPGQCIFCPNDVRMPKSYIATEPGAQRALANRFSPYIQVWNRLKAIENIGHPTDKIELLVLGGTWSSYPEKYQIWFVKELFRAMNDFGNGEKVTEDKYESIKEYLEKDYNDELRAFEGDRPYNNLIKTEKFKNDFSKFITKEGESSWEELEKFHEENSKGKCRCVGLVLETRPDSINEKEVLRLRKLGATKIQLGVQTLNDEISLKNKRGETKEDSERAFNLLRLGGFKIHAHMMPNLYGSTPEIDLEVYKELFESPSYKPDEVKIYPTSTIKYTELHKLYEQGLYKPYETETLVNLISDLMENTPEYCRLTRIIRDIPSTEIEAGNKTTNLREVVEYKLKKENRQNPNIRAREIKDKKIKFEDLTLDIITYETKSTTEYFLQYITQEREIAGFLRLSIPNSYSAKPDDFSPLLKRGDRVTVLNCDEVGVLVNPITQELSSCAMIREVHVYGPSLRLKTESEGEAQHLGLGSKLIEKAKEISKENGFNKLAVISAIGTREYYEKRGFNLNQYYQIAELN